MLATDAIMRALARHLAQDQEIWGLAGLLHDLDMELVDYEKEPEKQGAVGALMLEKMGVAQEITDAIRAHNEASGKSRDTLIEKAIYSADPLTGLIVASTLVLPSRKLRDLKTESILNRMKEKSFARGVNRDAIRACEEFGLNLEEFIKIGLEAMREIAEELGL